MLKSFALITLLALGASAQSSSGIPTAALQSKLGSVASSVQEAATATPTSAAALPSLSIPPSCAEQCKEADKWRCSGSDQNACIRDVCSKSETMLKPCMECANLTDTYNQFKAACVDAGFSTTETNSGARALAACVGGIALGAVVAVWF